MNEAQRDRGKVFLLSGVYEDAEISLAEALMRADEGSEDWLRLMIDRGWLHYKRGEYKELDTLALKVLPVTRKTGSRAWEAQCMILSGVASYSTGRYQEAVDSLEAARAIALELADPSIEMRALQNLAGPYGSLCRREEALAASTTAAQLAEELGDTRLVLFNRMNLATLRSNYGELSAALSETRDLLLQFQETGDRYNMCVAMELIASILYELGRYEESAHQATQSLELATRIGSRLNVGESLLDLGTAQRELGELKPAIESLTKSKAELYEIGAYHSAVAGCELALTLVLDGQTAEGLRELDLNLGQLREYDAPLALAEAHLIAARALEAVGKHSEATEAGHKALAGARRYGDDRLANRAEALLGSIPTA